MSLTTPVRRSSPRRVLLDDSNPSHERVALGPSPRPSPYQRRSPCLQQQQEVASSSYQRRSPHLQHQREMGSSPYQRRSPRLEQQRETLSSHDPLIELSIDVRLKNTVNQRLTSGLRMGTHAVQSDTWDEVKNMLWGIIQRELKPLAIPTGAPPVWTVDEHEPAIVMFEKYTSLKMNGKVLNPWTSAKDRKYLRKHKEEPAILSVYR